MTKLVTQLALCAAFFAVQATCWADLAPLPTLSPPPPPVSLNVPPPFPLPSEVPPPEFLIYAFPAAGLSLDTSNREAVRVFFKGLYFQSDNLAINWTGQQATCAAGTTDQLYQDAVALRVNWFRAMAGVPANVNLYGPYSQQDQPAALVMSTNNSLSHTPPSNWNCWSQAAYNAAGKSNLMLGLSGASAVSGYILDNGTSNTPIGHRRWVLYPQTQNMGTGDVPAGSYNTASVMAANALWVLDSHTYDTRPAVRDDFVAWPPKGYVPYQVVYGRWSLSHSSADFTNATVTVSKGGVNIPVSIEALHNGFGENTIVWLLQGVNDITVWPKPAADDTYAVTVANVWLNGVARTFSYNVTVFDPDTPTPNAAQTVVSAPASASVNSAFAVSLTPMTNASSYQLALYRLASLAGAFTSASNASAWTYVTGPATPYNPIEATAFHLYHSDFANQSLTLDKKLYIGQNASLSFLSWFTYATSGQVAHVQISLDDGASWQDVYTEVGSNNTAQSTKIVDLTQFAGHFARLKYEFVYILGQSAYFQSSTGWYFNNINLGNVSEMLDGQTVSVAALQSNASLTVTTAGSYALAGRTEYQGSYFTDWGQASVFQVSAVAVNGLISQTISFTNPGAKTLGTAPFALSATGGASGNPVTFTSQTASICTVSGSSVTLVAVGTCTVAADQAGNASYAAAPQVTQNITVGQSSRLINLSTRSQVQTGNNVMIGGFIIGGSTPKKVLIRAVGPNLANYGVTGVLANPVLELHRSSDGSIIASNDDWQTATNAASIQATGLAPVSPLESAILITLPPGAYTAIVTGNGGGTGVGIVEVYDIDHPEIPLINISTRGQVQTGDNVMIGGFIIQGDSPQTVLIRAVGPNLANYGVTGVLADPMLELHRSSDGAIIASNDNWQSAANAAAILATGLAPVSPLESAILITLPPGAYTAIVSGANGGTGVGIVEVFAQ